MQNNQILFITSIIFLCVTLLSFEAFAIDLPKDTIVVEAEDGKMDNGVKVVDKKGASGKAIDSPKEAMTTHEISIPSSGKWYVWIRLYCPDGSADSYWVGITGATPNPNDINGGPEAVKIYSEAGDSVNTAAQPFEIWYWDSGVNSEPPARRFFDVKSPGKYKFWSKGRESGTLLDQMLLTMDENFNAEKASKGEPIMILRAVSHNDKLSVTWGKIRNSD